MNNRQHIAAALAVGTTALVGLHVWNDNNKPKDEPKLIELLPLPSGSPALPEDLAMPTPEQLEELRCYMGDEDAPDCVQMFKEMDERFERERVERLQKEEADRARYPVR